MTPARVHYSTPSNPRIFRICGAWPCSRECDLRPLRHRTKTLSKSGSVTSVGTSLRSIVFSPNTVHHVPANQELHGLLRRCTHLPKNINKLIAHKCTGLAPIAALSPRIPYAAILSCSGRAEASMPLCPQAHMLLQCPLHQVFDAVIQRDLAQRRWYCFQCFDSCLPDTTRTIHASAVCRKLWRFSSASRMSYPGSCCHSGRGRAEECLLSAAEGWELSQQRAIPGRKYACMHLS